MVLQYWGLVILEQLQTCYGRKAVLFKKFADVDGIDLEIDTEDAEKFIDAVSLLEPSFEELIWRI